MTTLSGIITPSNVLTDTSTNTVTNKTLDASSNTITNVSLSTGVTGTLPVANGGTGATTLTAENVILGDGTSAVKFVAPGTSGNLLTSDGTTWASTAPAASGLSAATQAEMETATSNTVAATPLKYTIPPWGGKGVASRSRGWASAISASLQHNVLLLTLGLDS
jgi:hypothetical protein